MNMRTTWRAGLGAIMLMVVLAPMAPALEPAVPVDLQAAVISNLWQLDRNFPRRPQLTLGVLYQEKFRASFVAAHDLCDAFGRSKLPVRCVLIDISGPSSLADQLPASGIDAAYIAPMRAADVGVLVLVLRSKRIRTVTVVDEYMSAGVAVELTLSGDHAQIVVNLPAARAEGADFSSQLLKLARVIQ